MLRDERIGAFVPDGWTGDLRDMTMTAWSENSDLAAIVIVVDHEARGWVNLRHCHPEQYPLIWLRLRAEAARRPPLAMVWASDLASLLHGKPKREA